MGLSVLSFHSVKGGVGKSTLATLSALRAAQRVPERKVWLIDMDLTGTSLSDALPLLAPKLGGEPHPLLGAPAGWLGENDTRDAVGWREQNQTHPGPPVGVAYLNDWLMFADGDWERDREAELHAIAWRLRDGPENLNVLPSSALPQDLSWILPVIFDEEHAAFLEGRLELLLAAIARQDPDGVVVFDVPPTLPGLSRAVLGLGLRLGISGRESKPLATLDPWIPPELARGRLRARAVLVASQDHQDIRAMFRWIHRIQPEDFELFQLALNRVSAGDAAQRWADLSAVLEPDSETHPLWLSHEEIEDSKDLRIFRGDLMQAELALMDRFLDGIL